MPVLLILLVAAVVEVAVLVAVGDAIGVLPTIGLLLLAAAVGVWLLRREGSRTLRAFTEAARTRRPPHRELIDGVLIAAGAVLIVVPGFVSGVLGLLVLLPPTRALLRRRMLRSAINATPRFGPGGVVHGGVVHGGVGNRTVGDRNVVDGEVVDDAADHPTTGQPRDVTRRTSRDDR